ncbi:hypothetical protein [Enterococcus camelliae]|uniref:Permease n=1 Tax=Enterococcus camelliae TaxID=453959 RepID=A0ABW5TL61_9ENTE
MHFLIGLSLLYASAMGVAAIKAISIRHYPSTLLCNLMGVVLVFLALVKLPFLYFGIETLFFAAILNGVIVFQKVTPRHILIRLIFSLILVSFVYWIS